MHHMRLLTVDWFVSHVHIPKQLLDYIPGKWRGRILADEEWRSIGILQSPGWVNYMYHAPEPVSAPYVPGTPLIRLHI